MKTNQKEWHSIKVPDSIYVVLRWLSFSKKKFVYEILAELLWKEMEGNNIQQQDHSK